MEIAYAIGGVLLIYWLCWGKYRCIVLGHRHNAIHGCGQDVELYCYRCGKWRRG
jgi:hypothetical protein